MWWGIVAIAAGLQAEPSSLEEGIRLQHALSTAKLRLRGLQRHEKKEAQEHNATFWAFQAMNDTLHKVLEPKLDKAQTKMEAAKTEAKNATNVAKAVISASNHVAKSLLQARQDVKAAESNLDEANREIEAAERARDEAEDVVRNQTYNVSHLEQKLLYFNAQAQGANNTASQKVRRANLTAVAAKRFATIAKIERERVDSGSVRAIALTNASLQANLEAQAAAEEDIAVLQERMHAWRRQAKSRAEVVAREKAEKLQKEADEMRAKADALAKAASEKGSSLVKESPYQGPETDWAWDHGEDIYVDDDDDEPSQ